MKLQLIILLSVNIMLMNCSAMTGLTNGIGTYEGQLGPGPNGPVSASSRAVNWAINPQNSINAPILTDYLEIDIQPVQGAKYYLLERVSDMAGTSIVPDSYYPKWLDNNRTVVRFTSSSYQKSSVVGPHYLRVSAWTGRPWNSGTKIGADSNVLAVHYDHSYENLYWDTPTTIIGPGQVNFTVVPQNATLGQQSRIFTFFEYVQSQDPITKELLWDVGGVPLFSYTGEAQQLLSPTLEIAIASPGVRYYGLYGAWNGMYGYTSSPMMNSGLKSKAAPIVGTRFQPIAVVVPYENGTVPDTIVNFTGPKVVTPAIPGDFRMPLTKTDVTFLNGTTIYLNLGNVRPKYAEMELPHGMRPLDDPYPAGTIYKALNVSSLVTDGSLQKGYDRWRLNKTTPASQWSYLDTIIPFQIEYDEAMFNGAPSMQVRVRIYNNASHFMRVDNWQTMTVRCQAIPDIQLPKRLTTGITWGSTNDIFNSTLSDIDSFLSRYKQLGMNTVPTLSMHYMNVADLPARTFQPEERVGPYWDGMSYGPEHSTFYRGMNDGYGIFTILEKPVAFADTVNFLNLGVSPGDVAAERQKLRDALEFYENFSVMDMAYDGVILERDLQHIRACANATQPEYLFIDSEHFPALTAYRTVVNKSEIANSRRLPGENDDDLAARISDEFMQWFTENISAVAPGTKVALYGSHSLYDYGFQFFTWATLEKYGIVCQPSVYTIERFVEEYAYYMRLNREALPKGYDLVPWLSSGTYGEMTPDLVLDAAAHAFMNGATGFSYYSTYDFDDMADLLNLARVIGAVSPHEDIIMDGELAYRNITNVSNAVVSAMELNGTYLVAVSAVNTSNNLTFEIPRANGSMFYKVSELLSNTTWDMGNGRLFLDIKQKDCAIYTATPYPPPLPPNEPPHIVNVWPPNGSMNISLGSWVAVQVADNDSDLMNIYWNLDNSNGSTPDWTQFGSNMSVANGTFFMNDSWVSSYNTTYRWAVNLTDGKNWTNGTFSFTTVKSLHPVISNPNPPMDALNISINLTELRIDISDSESDLLVWSIETYPDVGTNGSTGDSGGTKHCQVSGLKYNSSYLWIVNATDPTGSRRTISYLFIFTVEKDPNIPPPPPPPPPPPVNLPPSPVPNGPYYAHTGEVVFFSTVGSYDPDGNITTMEWIFGDGARSFAPWHTYFEPGNYTVTLIATDDDNLSANASTTAYITRTNKPPIMLMLEEVKGQSNHEKTRQVRFSGSDPDGDDLLFIIFWGDGTTNKTDMVKSGSIVYLNHTYLFISSYDVRVYCTDYSSTESQAKNITVVIEKEPDTEVNSGMAGWLVFFIGLLIALIMVFVIIIAIVKRRTKADRVTSEEGKGVDITVDGPNDQLSDTQGEGPADKSGLAVDGPSDISSDIKTVNEPDNKEPDRIPTSPQENSPVVQTESTGPTEPVDGQKLDDKPLSDDQELID